MQTAFCIYDITDSNRPYFLYICLHITKTS